MARGKGAAVPVRLEPPPLPRAWAAWYGAAIVARLPSARPEASGVLNDDGGNARAAPDGSIGLCGDVRAFHVCNRGAEGGGQVSNEAVGCPCCGTEALRKNRRDRQGRQIRRYQGCGRRFTVRSATPFAGEPFPPAIIALAVRWSLRYADVAELLADRGVRVEPSTVYDWVRESAPRYEDVARPFHRAVGTCWGVDETDAQVAGRPVYIDRAVDVSARRAAVDAAACFRRAIEATGVIPDAVTTDGAAAYPPALAAALPPVAHETGKVVQQRIERDPQHLKGGMHGMRGFKALAGARVLCRAHVFRRNLRGGFDDLGRPLGAATASPLSPVVLAWDARTSHRLTQ